MKTSRPRTFSKTRTKTFPSLKVFVSDCASSIPSREQIARARVPLACPLKILSSPNGSLSLAEELQTRDLSMPEVLDLNKGGGRQGPTAAGRFKCLRGSPSLCDLEDRKARIR